MPNPAVSVIMPVYNAMPYLEECLNSVCSQTLGDIEVLCVDDGSTDESLEFLESRAKADGRIKVLEQNDNAGTARNLGMANANGEFLSFLDADDFFAPEMLERAYDKASETDADMVVFGGRRYNSDTGEVSEKLCYIKPKIIKGREVFSRKDLPNQLFQATNPAPWNKLFRKSFVDAHGLRFQSLPNSNDLRFVYCALASADRIASLEEDLVRYRRFTKVSSQDTKRKDPLCFLEALKATEDYLVESGLYKQVEVSFERAAIHHIKYNLASMDDRKAQDQILDAICDRNVLKTPIWDKSDKAHSFKITANEARYLDEAVAEWRSLRQEPLVGRP